MPGALRRQWNIHKLVICGKRNCSLRSVTKPLTSLRSSSTFMLLVPFTCRLTRDLAFPVMASRAWMVFLWRRGRYVRNWRLICSSRRSSVDTAVCRLCTTLKFEHTRILAYYISSYVKILTYDSKNKIRVWYPYYIR